MGSTFIEPPQGDRGSPAPPRGEAEERVNRELESFCQSASHELRAPLRAIDGLAEALLEDYGDTLDAQGKQFLTHMREATRRMGRSVDDLLGLARVARGDLQRRRVDLSALAVAISEHLRDAEPSRQVDIFVEDNVTAEGDPGLLEIALENLLGNAWKYTSKRSSARIEFGTRKNEGARVYFVRDDGAGFEMKHAPKLFGAFQRLHSAKEFEGSGMGLAIVQRVIHRHGGRVWAEGEVNRGATFYFTVT